MKPKFFSAWAKATSENGETHYVTVVGKLEQNREDNVVQDLTNVETKPHCFTKGILTYNLKQFNRKLTLGMSICHPSDTFDEQKGIEVAKKRIEKGDFLGVLETQYVTMLTKDAIAAEIMTKLNHICGKIDNYISEN